MIRIAEHPFNPADELARFEKAAENAGAVVSFLGKVRKEGGEDEVLTLHLEHYPGVTEASIADFVDQAKQRWPIDQPLIIHRVGDMTPGDAIVLVCVSAMHRRAAFEAADFLMDYLKTKALFWKKEIRKNTEAWIEPRDDDYQHAALWGSKEKDAT